MTAPSLRSLGTVVATSTSSPSFAAPAGAASTDVILVAFNLDDGRSTVTGVPTGFTQASGSPQTNDPTLGDPSHNLCVYWGRFSAVGAGPYGFTVGAGTPFVEGRAAAIQGCITTGNPFEATSGATSGNTAVTTAPSVSATSTDVDRYAFYAATNWTGGAWTPATGFVEQWDANDENLTFDDKALPTAQTVTPQAVCAASNRSNAWVGILLPPASATLTAAPSATGPGRLSPTGQLVPWMGTGAIAGQVFTANLAGSMTPAGTLAKADSKPLAGAAAPAGALAKQDSKALSGALTGSGGLAKLAAKALAGGVTPSGALTTVKVVLRSFAGAITGTGGLTRQASKGLAGTAAPAGALMRSLARTIAGAITAIGSLTKGVTRPLAGGVTPSGAITNVKGVASTPGSLVNTTRSGSSTSSTTSGAGTATTASGRMDTTTRGGAP